MRRALMVLAMGAVAAFCVIGEAAEKPPATLMGPDVASYTELNLDRLQAKTPDLAALREALAKMQVLKVAEQMFSQDPKAKELFDEVMGVATGLSDALGPRLGVAVWLPDPALLVSAAAAGRGQGQPSDLPGIPKLLLVAELRDPAKFEQLWGRLVERLDIPVGEDEQQAELTRTPFAVGGGLSRGDTWMAVGFSLETIEEVEQRATARSARPSLAADPAYQKVMAGLPKEAVLTEYIGPQVLRQLSAAATLLMPSVRFAPPPQEGIGVAVGVKVQEQGGRQMVTVYKTADLDALSYVLDVPLSLAATAAYPAMVRARESARRVQCLSNVKNISLAVQMYAVDNDRFPDADKWVEQLQEYIRNESVLKCPDDQSKAKCSYGFNSALSGKSPADVLDPSQVVVIYETAHPGDCPSGGEDDVASPPRHLGGNNFGYADGHARWCHEGEPLVFKEMAEGEGAGGEE